ncbi:MAG: hypothetical protein ABEJ07_05845 [Candidatus Nanohaloarchaea archaeon]
MADIRTRYREKETVLEHPVVYASKIGRHVPPLDSFGFHDLLQENQEVAELLEQATGSAVETSGGVQVEVDDEYPFARNEEQLRRLSLEGEPCNGSFGYDWDGGSAVLYFDPADRLFDAYRVVIEVDGDREHTAGIQEQLSLEGYHLL